MTIHFQIEYFTRWGEELFLCLNMEDGTQLCLEMQNDSHGTWYVDHTFDDEEIMNRDLSYQYLVRTDGNISRQEEGRPHTIPFSKADRLVLSDRWKESGLEIDQRTVAIPYVRHNGEAMWKGAGTSIPVFSLRSDDDFGIGEFMDLIPLADWAEATGQCIIQTLPVNDTIMTRTWRDSYPYSANSSFALNPIYLRLQDVGTLGDKEFLERMESLRKELNALPEIDFERVLAAKTEYIDHLFEEFGRQCLESKEFKKFFNANRQWLEPYATYCYLRDKYGTSDFNQWPENRFSMQLLHKYCVPGNKRFLQIQKQYFVQYHLHRQFRQVKKYVNGKGILLKGDIPIGVNRHSSDAWIFPELFNMDCQAGAPPDDFAADGQKWGMPTYNWENMAKSSYSWFKARFRKMADYFDAYRIDHLLGFFRIWEIPLKYDSGLMGHFNPCLPLSVDEIHGMGFHENPQDYASAPEGSPETNVLFLEDTRRPGMFHPRINAFDTQVFQSLPEDLKQAFRNIHDDFYYHRNDWFWQQSAMQKLPAIINATDMIVCGEDLGMIPQCVPGIMDRLRIMSLEVQRMPKRMGIIVDNPADYHYMSVCTPSTHDMSVLRSWIDNEMPDNWLIGSGPATTELCRQVLESHLASKSMLAIFLLQDWLSVDESVRASDPDRERINIPADPDNYWRYRMHLTVGNLLAADSLNDKIRRMIHNNGR